MQKQYKQTYFNLTRHNPLPTNCLPFTSRRRHSQSLAKLLQVNQTIMNLVDHGPGSLFSKKRNSHNHFLSLSKNIDKQKTPPKRIHRNKAYLASTINPQSSAKKMNTFRQKSQENQQINEARKKRKDLYDESIEKYMSSKYDKQEIIEQYLQNKEMFVKQACMEIQDQIKQEVRYLKKSTQKLKQKSSHKKLPKIEEFISKKFKKSQHRVKNADYIKSITHLKKAQTLQLKDRQRKQRIFRHKINSLGCRLDKIRDDSLN